MTSSDPPVVVTGASGFVASHLVALLLDRGHTVHATVRDLADEAKVGPLRAIAAGRPGQLKLFAADLLVAGSFDAAVAGAATVHHVASPFKLPEKIRDGAHEMVQPALEGTRNVLGAVARAESVSTVVLTSTVGAIFGDYIDVLSMEGQTLSEGYWNETSTVQTNPYHYAKTVAEREAWRIAGDQDRWRLVSINPGLVLGPSLTPGSESGSLFLLDELLRGEFFYGAADLSFTIVDVRDVALAHVAAAQSPDAHGRYIVARPEMLSFLEIARILRPVATQPWRLPRWQVPDWAVRLIGPRFGLTPQFITNHLGIRFAVDNRRSVQELGIEYRPASQTLHDHLRSWEAARG